MSEAGKAVFLSYASQDAEAARRICEALRSGGVEVWFDADGGLEHGDEWDAKIRRQIKECVLFIPVISANTQAREEGYFRIEWELAAQRAMGIASGVPFILPVVIDDTREPDALVPDRFRVVQWTRLRAGEVPPEVRARLLKLWSHRTGVLRFEEASGSSPTPAAPRVPPAAETIRQPGAKVYALIAAAIIAIVGGVGWWLLRDASPKPGPVAAVSAPLVKPASAASGADALVAHALTLVGGMNYTRDDLAVAEDLTRRATDAASDSASAWAARAYVQAVYIQRSWDLAEKRRQDAQDFARRALAIDQNEPEALLALAIVLNVQHAFAQAEIYARRALAVRPGDYRPHNALGAAVDGQGRADEALAILQEAVRRFPHEPLTHYALAQIHVRAGRFDEALASYNATLAEQVFAGALLAKARLLVSWKGDFAAARATLDQMKPDERPEDRAVGVAMWIALLAHEPVRVHEAAALTARNYLEDSIQGGPKAWPRALAYRLEGKDALAAEQWQAAEATLRPRVRDQVANAAADRARLAITLAWLGRTEEAAREIAAFESAAREQPSLSAAVLLAQFYAGLGDTAHAMPFVRQAFNKTPDLTFRTLPLDPWWDKLRTAPEFVALLNGPAPAPKK